MKAYTSGAGLLPGMEYPPRALKYPFTAIGIHAGPKLDVSLRAVICRGRLSAFERGSRASTTTSGVSWRDTMLTLTFLQAPFSSSLTTCLAFSDFLG